MVDLSVLNIFEPVSLISTKNRNGDGITFKSNLNQYIRSNNADQLAKIIQKEAARLEDEAKKLELIERSLAYIRVKGGSDLSSDVYEQLKDKDSSEFIDVFGAADKVPSSVQSNTSAKTAWGKIMTGRAYDHIEENKTSIYQDLDCARSEAGGSKILKVADNPALVNLKEELMESGMSSTEADEDISRMLRQTKDSDGSFLLKADESVQIEMDSPSSALSADRTEKLEELRDKLTARIDKAKTPEEAKRILERSVDDFEALRPRGAEPGTFYSEQMQAVLDESEKYKDYHVAATPSLEKITKNGEELIKTTNDKVFVNKDGKFVVKEDDGYHTREPDKNDKITVGGKKIDIKDIKPSQPKIRILMDTNENKVEDRSLEDGQKYIEDQRLVYEANGDKEALRELKRAEKVLDETEDAVIARRKREEKEGKSDNNDTLKLILGIIGSVATIAAALSQGRGTTTTVTGGGTYHPQAGTGGGAYHPQPGYGYGSYYPVSDKYGYNRGYQATVDAAYERSNQYLSTLYNNPVRLRASIMRQNGMRAIQEGAGI